MLKTKEIELPFFKKNETETEQREVSFYIFAFDKPDLQNDIITKSTVIDIHPHCKYFLNHDMSSLLGTIKEIGSDDFGVYATVKIANTTLGNDIYELYKVGAITQHSVGIYVLDHARTKDGLYELKHVKLMEVSTLTHFAAQPLATTISVKSNQNITNNMMTENKKKEKSEGGYNNVAPQKKSFYDKEARMKLKATEEELNELAQKVSEIENKTSEMVATIGNLNAFIETMREKYVNSNNNNDNADFVDTAKSIGTILQEIATKRINKRISTSELFKLKNINFTGTGYRDVGSTFYNSIGYKRRLLDLFKKEFVKTSNVVWSGFSSHTIATGNNSIGCYTPNLSDVNVRHENASLNRVVAVTDYCVYGVDSVENETDFFVKVAELLLGEVETKISNSVYTQFTTLGTNQTATPSWVGLAGTVTDTTLVDILHIHGVDINALTGGKINPIDCVMVVNPVDYSRFFTDKTASYRDVATLQEMGLRIVHDLSVPIGNYVVLPDKYLTLFLLGSMDARISTPAGLDAFGGVEYIGIEISYALSLSASVNNNVVIYGNIANAIANY